MVDNPYREAAGAPAEDQVRTIRRRRSWPRWLGMAGMVVGPLAGPAFPVVAAIGMSLFGGWMIDANVRRRRANTVLNSPPFGIVPIVPPRGIQEVTVRLGALPDDDAARRIADSLLAIANLSVTIEGDRIMLTGWTWKYDDRLLLAAILDTWGRRVHAEHGVAEVTVQYR